MVYVKFSLTSVASAFVNGTIAAIDLGAKNEIFNLGNHQPVPLMEFIKILEQGLGKKAKLTFLPMQQGDVYQTYADIQHSASRLGYHPSTSLEEGIPQFVDWFFSFANKVKSK